MSGQKVVLLSCGSFNPVTNMHLRLFELAHDYLTKRNQSVIGGIISPTHDGYEKAGLIASTHRVEMCRLATATSDWVKVDAWESEQSGWLTTVKVMRHFHDVINQAGDNVRLKFLCGADLIESFSTPGLWLVEDIEEIVGRHGLMVVMRKGSDPATYIDQSPILSKLRDSIDIVEEWIPNEISATKIREARKTLQSIRYLVPDPVLEYITKHNLYKI